ncbi:MAG: DUF4974 domain-containing protein [Bacteroidales bacterium]|nr:MAG: DUF4974 domain-containing protein [Bacteroidales bacterium]
MTSDNQNSDDLNNKELEQFLSEMKGVKVPPSSRSKEDAWRLLMQSVVEEESKVVSMSNSRVWYAIAASVVIFIVAGWSYAWFSTTEKYAPKGYVSDVVLPDGTQIKLNADSKISYPKFFNLVGRKFTLEGEAFFRVMPGEKFTVKDSQNRTVEVLGTEFNVNTRGTVFKVACYQGSVKVHTPETDNVKLTSGLKFESVDGVSAVNSFQSDSISSPSWINGEFYFEGAKLSEVIAELEVQFNVTIVVEGFNPEERIYSGFFRNNNLENAIELVTLPMGLNYEITPDSSKVIISK